MFFFILSSYNVLSWFKLETFELVKCFILFLFIFVCLFYVACFRTFRQRTFQSNILECLLSGQTECSLNVRITNKKKRFERSENISKTFSAGAVLMVSDGIMGL